MAVEKSTFPPDVPFAAFASVRLRGQMINFIYDIQHTRDRAVPFKLGAKARNLVRQVYAVQQTLGRTPTLADLHAAIPGVTTRRLVAAARVGECVATSWERPGYEVGGEEATRGNAGSHVDQQGGLLVGVGEEGGGGWEEKERARMVMEDVERLLAMLPAKDALVLRLCYDVRERNGGTAWERRGARGAVDAAYPARTWQRKHAALRRARGNKEAMRVVEEIGLVGSW